MLGSSDTGRIRHRSSGYCERVRVLVVLLVALFGGAGCKSKGLPSVAVSSADTAAGRFWRWFEANAKDLRAEPDLPKTMERISEALAKEHKGVFAEIGSDGSDRLLVLSVDGDKKLFPMVEQLYAVRPKVPGWKLIAFRQRDASLSTIEMNGRKLEPKAMKFIAERHGALFDVTVYVPGFTTADDFGNILFIALDHVVGEYDMETRIGGIEWAKLEAAPATARPLADLPKLIDETFPRTTAP